MLDAGSATDIATVVFLLAVSFFALIAGTVFRRWPDKVQALTADYDGFALFLSPEAYRAQIVRSGSLLLASSFGALLGAALLL